MTLTAFLLSFFCAIATFGMVSSRHGIKIKICFLWLCVKALRRSKARSERLQEALNDVRRSATLEEELAVWLREAENHLKEKEKEMLSSDRASIEASLREQTVCAVCLSLYNI